MKNTIICLIAIFGVSAMARSQEEKAETKFRPTYICELNTGILTFNDFRSFVHVKNGVSLTPHFDLSLGLGAEGHLTGRYIPILLEGRYNILTGNVRPFVSCNFGYLQVVQSWTYSSYSQFGSNHKGLTVGVKMGVQKQFSPSLSFSSSIGYRFSATSYVREYYDWWGGIPTAPETVIHNMNRFELSIGLIFR